MTNAVLSAGDRLQLRFAAAAIGGNTPLNFATPAARFGN